MKLVNPSVKTIKQEPGLEGIYKICAETAYICYQTDPEKASRTPEEFIKKSIIPSGHNRVLEFGTVYLEIPYWQTYETTELVSFFKHNHWSRVKFIGEPTNPRWAVTTNLRVIIENNLTDLLTMYICEPSEHHILRYTAEFICSRGASDDFRTHIELSSMAESTRWCNYSKGKYNGELTFIDPYWKEDPSQYSFTLNAFKIIEEMYLEGARLHMEPQQLKRIYSLGGKTQLRLCGFKDAWDNFFKRRMTGNPDPECKLLATQLQNIIYN